MPGGAERSGAGNAARASAGAGARAAGAVVAMAVLAGWGSAAWGHVGPSPERNNRYLTLVAEPGALHIEYSLFYGERPGATARQRMDSAGDGVLSAAEQRAFAAEVGEVVAGGLRVELDGTVIPVEWDSAETVVGSESAAGGSFSIGLSATICFEPAGEHRVFVQDAFRVPPVGEGGLVIEPAGVRLLRSAMGDGDGVRTSFKWMGLGALADEGYVLEFEVPESARPPRVCHAGDEQASADPGVRGAQRAREGVPVAAGPGASAGSPPSAAPSRSAQTEGWRVFAVVLLIVSGGMGVALGAVRPAAGRGGRRA